MSPHGLGDGDRGRQTQLAAAIGLGNGEAGPAERNHFLPDGRRYPDLSPSHIVERCEASLTRLGVETIDLYLLHFYDVATPLQDIAEVLQKLCDQGKVRKIGVSNHSVEQLRANLQSGKTSTSLNCDCYCRDAESESSYKICYFYTRHCVLFLRRCRFGRKCQARTGKNRSLDSA